MIGFTLLKLTGFRGDQRRTCSYSYSCSEYPEYPEYLNVFEKAGSEEKISVTFVQQGMYEKNINSPTQLF